MIKPMAVSLAALAMALVPHAPASGGGLDTVAGAVAGTAASGAVIGGTGRACLKHKVLCGTAVAIGGFTAYGLYEARKRQQATAGTEAPKPTLRQMLRGIGQASGLRPSPEAGLEASAPPN